MRVKVKLGAVRGRKSLETENRTKILRKDDTTSAWKYTFKTTKFKAKINHSVSMISYNVNNNCRPTTVM
jgi:hypothetical protein